MDATIQVTLPPTSKRPLGTNWDTLVPGDYPVLSAKVAYSWGSEPSQANVVYPGDVPITTGTAVKLTIGNYFFAGVCERDTPLESSSGHNRELTILDFRRWLDWDKTYCSFNTIDDSLNPATNTRQRRYLHILPWNHSTYRQTWTLFPYSAAQIINFVFQGPGVETPWRLGYLNALGQKIDDTPHPNLAAPVYNVDAINGKSLSVLLNEICEQCGLSYTLIATAPDDLFRIVFAQRGVDGPEIATPDESDNRQNGIQLSGNPTRVRVLGDRNLYQVHDIALVPDWNTKWSQFWDVDLLADYLFKNKVTWNSSTDPDQIIARMESKDLASRITVAEFDVLMGNTGAWRDNRKYGGRSRNFMPAALYIQNLLFRCFRLPTNFFIRNTYGAALYSDSLRIEDKLLAYVTHNPTTGVTDAFPSESVDGNAYVIVKGYCVGKDMFESIRPERFDLTKWTSTQAIWQKIDVRIEDAGEPGALGQLIVFDEPVVSSSNLVEMVDGYAVFKANPTISVPQVRATLTLAGEKFSWFQSETDPGEEDQVFGTQNNDTVLNVGGLYGEFILLPKTALYEIYYADGYSCRGKAILFGNNLLKNQPTYSVGGFTTPVMDDSAAYVLHGKMDRISLDYSVNGTSVSVERTSERQRMNFVPERDLDRMRNLRTLLPGQDELRRQADSIRKIANTVRASKDSYRLLADAFNGTFVDASSATPATIAPTSNAESIPIGSVFVKAPNTVSAGKMTNTLAIPQSAGGVSHKIFAGVSVRNTESIDATKGAVIRLQNTGVALVRVLGPVSVGDSLVTAPTANHDALVKKDATGSSASSIHVGIALQDITSGTKLIRVQLGGDGGGSTAGIRYRGTWSGTEAYVLGDIVRKQTGADQGLYICTTSGSGLEPSYPENAGWDIWAFGPAQITRCAGGTDVITYINAITSE